MLSCAHLPSKQPKKDDEAVALLWDLRDLCARAGRPREATKRIAPRVTSAKKPSLIDRLRKAALL